jgi:hypothetical protein
LENYFLVFLSLAPASISNVVGSFSLGASSSAVACSVFQSSDVLPLQVSSHPQSCITSSQSFSGAVELGKRLCSSFHVLSNSKSFQKYNRKAGEAREVHLDENLFADSMEALRPAQGPGFLFLLLSDPVEKVAVVPPVQDKGKSPSPVKGFLRRGFLNLSPVVTHKVLVVSASNPVIKEGVSTPGSPTAIKGDDFMVNSLTQSQKRPVGFDSSGEVVAWEQGDEIWDGDDGDSLYTLGVLPPDLALDWELDSDEDMDLSLAIMEFIEEDFHRGVKGRASKDPR